MNISVFDEIVGGVTTYMGNYFIVAFLYMIFAMILLMSVLNIEFTYALMFASIPLLLMVTYASFFISWALGVMVMFIGLILAFAIYRLFIR